MDKLLKGYTRILPKDIAKIVIKYYIDEQKRIKRMTNSKIDRVIREYRLESHYKK